MYQQGVGRQGGSFLSTLVSLESTFNAEQEHDNIFAVAYTTEEIPEYIIIINGYKLFAQEKRCELACSVSSVVISCHVPH